MSKKKITIGVTLGGLSLFVDGISGLLLFPMLLHFLTKELAGLWILFLSFSNLINLAQAGMGPVVTRMTAETKGEENPKEKLIYLYNLVNRSYQYVTLGVVALTFIIYIGYLHWVLRSSSNFNDSLLAWIFLSLGYAIRMYALKNLHLVNGLGELGWDKLLQIFTSLLCIIGYFVVLSAGYRLTALGLIFFLSAVVYLQGSKIILNRFLKLDVQCVKCIQNKDIFLLMKNSASLLMANVSGFLVMSIDVFVVERFFGLDIVPLYSALSKIVSLIIAIALLVQQMTYPYIAINWAQKNFTKCKDLYKKGIYISTGVGLIMSLIAVCLAPYIIPIWLGKGNYLGPSVFGWQLMFAVFYIHLCSHANPVIATGAPAFIGAALTNSVLALPFAIILSKIIGLPGVSIGILLATLLPSCYVIFYCIKYFRTLEKQYIVRQ